MLIEAVERRFGSVDAVPAAHALEFLSDNGGAYIAAETRALARELGLKRPSAVRRDVMDASLPAGSAIITGAHEIEQRSRSASPLPANAGGPSTGHDIEVPKA